MQFHIIHKSYKSRIRELWVGGVRGLGVRGLGLKQKKEKLNTEAKIVGFLRVTPLTYEQLQKISRIHRNTLKLRLDHLSSKGIIMAHRYSIPYELKYYGYMFRHPVKYWPPLFNRLYYLLNLSKSKQIKELLFHYLTMNEEEWEVDRVAGKIEMQNQPSFSLTPSIIAQALLLSREGNSNKRYRSPSELIENRSRLTEIILYTFRWLREYDLSAVKNRVYISEYSLREKETKNLKNIIKFFTRRGFSLQDVLIRCSTEHTLIEGDRDYLEGAADPLSLPMTRYSTLWHTIKRHRLSDNSKELQ
jgi:hypothetical protein